MLIENDLPQSLLAYLGKAVLYFPHILVLTIEVIETGFCCIFVCHVEGIVLCISIICAICFVRSIFGFLIVYIYYWFLYLFVWVFFWKNILNIFNQDLNALVGTWIDKKDPSMNNNYINKLKEWSSSNLYYKSIYLNIIEHKRHYWKQKTCYIYL